MWIMGEEGVVGAVDFVNWYGVVVRPVATVNQLLEYVKILVI